MFDKHETQKPTKNEQLLATLGSGQTHDVITTIEDLLKLVFVEQFNNEWNKHNYILRNIIKTKTKDSGLQAVRSSATIKLDKNKDLYATEEVKDIVMEFYDKLIINSEQMLMQELVRQFKRIAFKTLHTRDGIGALNGMSSERILKYFMSKKPEELKNHLSIEIDRNWDWLRFGPERIMTMKFNDEYTNTYEVHMINKASYCFTNDIIEKAVDDLLEIYRISSIGGDHGKINYGRFNDICDTKRTKEIAKE